MSEDETKELKLTTQNLTTLVAGLTKAVENQDKAQQEHERTLRHIDDNVNQIKLTVANSELKHYKEFQALIDKNVNPAYELIRQHQEEFNTFKIHAEQEHQRIKDDTITDILKRVKVWAVIAAFLLTGIGITISLLYDELISKLHTH